jgi:hypothetical protein
MVSLVLQPAQGSAIFKFVLVQKRLLITALNEQATGWKTRSNIY